MASMNTAPAPSRSRSKPSAWVLAKPLAYIGDRPNDTTAKANTRKELPIEASFWRAPPPLPSELFVHYPGTYDHTAVFPKKPRVLCIVDDLILFRVLIPHPLSYPTTDLCDYFIYRADPKCPSLNLIPNEGNFFHDHEVGLLPRGDHQYTIAGLTSVPLAVNEYKLHLYDSETKSWSCKLTSVEVPQRDFSVEILGNCGWLHFHKTTTVITLGGESGTMGWVDLLRGILLCDVLHDEPILRWVPVPLPMKYVHGIKYLGTARTGRGIAFIKGCLKFVELDVSFNSLPYTDPETKRSAYQVFDWAINTWSNSKMGNSLEDWHKDDDCTVQASRIITNNRINSQMLQSGLLHKPPNSRGDAAERALQDLVVTEPTPSMNGDDVVYLMASVKFGHPKAWVLAVDLRNNKLQGVAEFGTQERIIGPTCCPSSISQCMYPVTNPVTGGTYGESTSWGVKAARR